jgi:uncharacterized membrane protein YsdA (DUF1294 family)
MSIAFPQSGSVAYLGLCIGVWLVVVSLVSFMMMAVDRRRAQTGGPRLPELNLLCLAAMGGWPGAVLGLRRFRPLRFSEGFRGWLRVVAAAQILLAGMAALPPQGLIGAAEFVAGVAMGQVRADERNTRPGRIVLNSKAGISNIVTISSDR